MGTPLRVLLVEDSEDDVLLIVNELRRTAGYEVEYERVDNALAMEAALRNSTWDIVLSDYSMPGFDGAAALQLFRQSGLDLPFIVVSGAIGESVAVRMMRAGAHDYLMKSNLVRLGPVVARGLQEAEDRRARSRAEVALRESEERYRSLQANLPVGAFRITPEGRFLSANPAMAAMLGYASVDDLMLVSSPEMYASPQLRQPLIEKLRREGVVTGHEIELRRRDGSTFWALVSIRAIKGSDKTTMVYQDGTMMDISQRKQLEEALIRGKTEWEQTFDAVPELVMLTDTQLRIVRINRSFSNLLDQEPRCLVGQYCYAAIDGEDAQPSGCPLLTSSQEAADFDLYSETLGGSFLFSVTPRYDDKGDLIGRIHVGRDVTAARQAEEVLSRSAMIDQAEHIFRTIRHEMGNALNTLKVTLSVLRTNYETFSPQQRETYFARSMDTFEVSERLLDVLKDFQKLDMLNIKPLYLDLFLDANAALLIDNARVHGVECKIDILDRPLLINGDRDGVLRMLLNVHKNAIAAIRDNPAPRITVACRLFRDQIVLWVSDNGQGIAEPDLARVFTPLFTTKPDGTGLGLAIVQRLMLQMGGLARIQSVVGRGTTVELCFPVATELEAASD